MVGQFVNAVGCSPDEATQMLTSARWQLEVRLCLILLTDYSFPVDIVVGGVEYLLPRSFSGEFNHLH